LPVELWQGSFTSYEPAAAFDAILIFGLIQEITPSQQRDLAARIRNWSAPECLLFVVGWHTGDGAVPELRNRCVEIEPNAFRLETGEVRSFLAPGEIVELFGAWQVVHHWEGLGPAHHHGDGKLEQHSRVELVGRFSS